MLKYAVSKCLGKHREASVVLGTLRSLHLFKGMSSKGPPPPRVGQTGCMTCTD